MKASLPGLLLPGLEGRGFLKMLSLLRSLLDWKLACSSRMSLSWASLLPRMPVRAARAGWMLLLAALPLLRVLVGWGSSDRLLLPLPSRLGHVKERSTVRVVGALDTREAASGAAAAAGLLRGSSSGAAGAVQAGEVVLVPAGLRGVRGLLLAVLREGAVDAAAGRLASSARARFSAKDSLDGEGGGRLATWLVAHLQGQQHRAAQDRVLVCAVLAVLALGTAGMSASFLTSCVRCRHARGSLPNRIATAPPPPSGDRAAKRTSNLLSV